MGLSSQLAPSAIARPGVIANAAARPASPYQGQVVFQTDTNQAFVWNGSAWTVIANATGSGSNVRLGYQTRTTNYTTGASIAAASDIFSSDITWTADGTSTYWVEFYCDYLYTQNIGGGTISIYLVDGSGNDLGRIYILGPATGTTYRVYGTCYVKVPYTPASGSRSVNIRAIYGTGSDAVLSAGAGGAGVDSPMWMAVSGPALT